MLGKAQGYRLCPGGKFLKITTTLDLHLFVISNKVLESLHFVTNKKSGNPFH
jgi:hypothetical protein